MTRALTRTALADLRRHRLQSLLIVVILATATATLTLGVLVNRLSSKPFDRMFRETHGAHLWFTADPGIDLTAIAKADGVTETAGPFPEASARVSDANGGAPLGPGSLSLMALPANLPATGRPLIREGRWLAAPDEIVLDPFFATFAGLHIGDRFGLAGPDGPVSLRIVGFADHVATWHVTGDGLSLNAYGYLLPETFERIVPDRSTWRSVLGVRLADPAASRAFAGAALDRFQAGGVTVDDWQDLRRLVTEDNQVNVVLLAVFSLFALVAAGLVIANSIGGRVVAQVREIGLLKAVGFTPRGVVALFLVENLVLGLVAAAIGLAAGVALTPIFQANIASLLSTTRISPYDPLPLALILLAVELAVALCTLVPALRGARIGTIEATTTGFAPMPRGGSRLAGIASRLRLPVVVVLGLKDAFVRPLRAWVTIAALVLTVVTLTFSLGMEATIRDIIHHPDRWGSPYDLLLHPNGASPAEVERALADEPAVASYLSRIDASARVEGSSTTVAAWALGGDVSPYDGSLIEGRQFSAPGEAVAGQAFLDLTGKKIGDRVRLWVDGRPLDLTIVGKFIATESGGRLVLFGLDTYRAQIDPGAEPEQYALRLRPGANPTAIASDLTRASGSRFAIQPIDLNESGELDQIRAVVFGLDVVLVVIGVVNLLTTTMLGVRERFRDVGILKSIGFTPFQAVESVLTGVGALAVVAVAVGIPLGLLVTRLLFDELGRRIGVGPGLGVMPRWSSLVLLLPAAVLLAILGGLLPARRAAAFRVSEALRYE
ncbi:MAG TPA: FtsX-like permease family protein [Thermomicrobiales bacterium]|nr:FtsX-like permease family protein [Thermomicrobiales bacterium]